MNGLSRRKKIPWYFGWLLSSVGEKIIVKHYIHHYVDNNVNWNFIVFAEPYKKTNAIM